MPTEDDLERMLRTGGGKIIGGDGAQLQPQPRTSHQTILRSTDLQLHAILSDDNTVLAYQLTLADMQSLHTYIYRFADEVFEAIKNFVEKAPQVGTKVEEEEDTGGE